MSIIIHKGDIPADINFGNAIAVDTETMGLNHQRDRLCVVQLSSGDGTAHLVQIAKGQKNAPNLEKILTDKNIIKIFHFARFDVAKLKEAFGIDTYPIYCTKIASRLCRTYTDRHGLREVCRELAGIDLNKQQQSSDWGADELTEEQKKYAANDVLYLHQIMEKLNEILIRENRMELAQKCFDFIPARAELDLTGWNDFDIFAH